MMSAKITTSTNNWKKISLFLICHLNDRRATLAIVISSSTVITTAIGHVGMCHLRNHITTAIAIHWPTINKPRSSNIRCIFNVHCETALLATLIFNKTPLWLCNNYIRCGTSYIGPHLLRNSILLILCILAIFGSPAKHTLSHKMYHKSIVTISLRKIRKVPTKPRNEHNSAHEQRT